MKKRILSMLLSIVMVIGLMPMSVFAADTSTAKTVELGIGSITGYDAANGYHYIYYGANRKSTLASAPIKWRVLDDMTNTGEAGLFVLKEDLNGSYGQTFAFSSAASNTYQNSTAKTKCTDFLNNNFFDGEISAIMETTKSDTLFLNSTGSYKFAAAENNLNGDKLFCLSAEEVENADYGFIDDASRIAAKQSGVNNYWLRSPQRFVSNGAGVVGATGNVFAQAVTVSVATIRPAFNLDANQVAFVETATGSQTTTGLVAVADYTGNEWKLNIYDSSRNFAVSETALSGKSGDTVSVNYSGAVTGTKEYVSAMIVNQTGTVVYYGMLTAASESGVAEFTIPADLADGTYTLKVFNEQTNGDKRTDYVSGFADITLTVEPAGGESHIHNGGTATCQSPAICVGCLEEYGEKDTANHTGGTEVRNASSATESQTGYTGDTYCLGCGELISAGTEIPVIVPHIHDNITYDTKWSGTMGDTTINTDTNIVLTDDVTFTRELQITAGTVNLCLNGKTLDLGYTGAKILNSAVLNVCDCEEGGMITCTSTGGTLIVLDNSTVTITGGTVNNGENVAILCNDASSVTVSGGKITSANSYAVQNNGTGVVKITGSAELSGKQGICNTNGEVEIDGGTVTGNGSSAIIQNGTGSITVSRGTVTGAGNYGIDIRDGKVYLSGSPTISGSLAAISKSSGAIYAADQNSNKYTGNALNIHVASPTEGTVVIYNVDTDNENKFVLVNTPGGYFLKKDGENLVLRLPHSHSWSTEWTSDGTYHWHECEAAECDVTENSQKDGYAQHSCNDDGNCETEVRCSCGAVVTAAKSHSFDNACDTTCGNPGCTHTREITHTPREDDGDCTTAIHCAVCDALLTPGNPSHDFDNACDTDCNRTGCNHTRTITHTPNADDGDCTTEIHCDICNVITTAAKSHSFDNACDTDCNNLGCKHTRTASHTPNQDDGDCTTPILCSVCNSEVVAATNHTYIYTDSTADTIVEKCQNCNFSASAQIKAPTGDLTYNGNAHNATVVYTGTLSCTNNLSVSYGEATDTVNAGEYTATITLGGKTASVTYTVNKAKVTPPTIADKVYNGTALTAEVPTNTLYTVEANNGGTNAGDYDVVLKLTDGNNYEWDAVEGVTGDKITLKFRITKATNVWTETPSIDGWTYGEDAKEPDGKAKFGTVAYKYYDAEKNVLSGVPTNAGTYYIVASVPADGDNYAAITSDYIAFTIAKAKLTPSITGMALNKTYDGTTDVPTTMGVTISLSGAVNNENPIATATFAFNSADVATASKINASEIVLDDSWADNYELTATTASVDASITAKIVTNPIIEVSTVGAYDGTEKEPAVLVKDGDAPIPESEYTVSYSDNVNAGTATVTITDKDGGNYTVSGNAKFQIAKATYDMSGVTFADASYPFDSAEKELVISGTLPEGVTVSYENNKLTNVGSIEATAKFSSDNPNYNAIESKTAKLTITNATFSVTANGYDGVYDGKTHTISVTADGATITYSTDGTNYSATKPEFTNAGTYTVYYKAVKANHSDVLGSATVKIAKATPVLTITPGDTSLWGGGRVIFKVTGAPAEGSYTITSDPAIRANNDGSFSLPNRTQTYVFTATYAESTNYTTATANCTVSTTMFIYIPTYYELSFDTNGGTAVSSITRVGGTTIDLTDYTTYMDGYIFNGWYSDATLRNKITSVRLTRNTTVYAGFTKIEIPDTPDPIVNPFKDIFTSDWYYDDVMFVYENKLMNGTATDLFSPALSTTRGMIVTILWRLEGEPIVNYNGKLNDVPETMYYAPAVDWAAANGILKGYGDGKFGPEDPITREQMATILYRYAQYKGYDVSVGENTNILSYADFAEISEYAIPALQWVCGEGIIGGRPGGILDPIGKAQRCEVAAILHRFCEEYVEE